IHQISTELKFQNKFMKKHILFLLLLFPVFIFSQKNKQQSKEILEIKKFQKDLNKEYLDPKETPLRDDNFAKFKQHPFFPIDLNYRVTAKFIKTENPQPFDLPTSSGKSKSYQ